MTQGHPLKLRNAESNNKMTLWCLLFSDIICLNFIGAGLSGLLCLWRAINFNRGLVRLLRLTESETDSGERIGRNAIRQQDRHAVKTQLTVQHKSHGTIQGGSFHWCL